MGLEGVAAGGEASRQARVSVVLHQAGCSHRSEATANTTAEDQRLESSLSTAEQIGVLEDALLHSNFFGDKSLQPATLARSLVSTLVRRVPEDVSILNKFWHATAAEAEGVKKRKKGEEAAAAAPKGDRSPELEAFVAGGKQALSSFK